MTKAEQQVLEDALLLSTQKRATVVDGLLESLDPPPSGDGLSLREVARLKSRGVPASPMRVSLESNGRRRRLEF